MARPWTPIITNGRVVTVGNTRQGGIYDRPETNVHQLRLPPQTSSSRKRAIAQVNGCQQDPPNYWPQPRTPQKRRKKRAQAPTALDPHPCHIMVTRRKARDSVCKAVFNTHELSLMILHELPMQHLLQTRRVCKLFNSLIMHDPKLQQQLFLQPEPQTVIWAYDTELISVRTHTPDSLATMETMDPTLYKRQRKTIPGQVNPLLFRKDEKHAHANGIESSVFSMMRLCDTMRFLRRPSLRPSVTATSLLHNMYVCQPPCTEVEFRWHFFAGKPRRKAGGTMRPSKSIRIRVWDRSGVKFGDLVQGFIAQAGKGELFPNVNPEVFFLKKAPSVVWMKGICFPSEEQREEVARGLWQFHH